MSSIEVDDRTLVVSFETVGLFPLFDRADGSKSGGCDN